VDDEVATPIFLQQEFFQSILRPTEIIQHRGKIMIGDLNVLLHRFDTNVSRPALFQSCLSFPHYQCRYGVGAIETLDLIPKTLSEDAFSALA
jgi:hypothetical protein